MKVYLDEIRNILDLLIQKKISREEVALWASVRRLANDASNLEFEPLSEEIKIWRSIVYLLGVDLKDIDGSYLHSKENFIDYRRKIDQNELAK